jgi:D-alanine-D-alanine ligase
LKIAILYGGFSAEYKVSIQTGLAIAEALKGSHDLDMVHIERDIYNSPHLLYGADLVYNALHGGDGEDGSIQSFMDSHHITYTGSGPKACKIAMDKNITKLIARSIGVGTADWFMLNKNLYRKLELQDNSSSKFSYPYVVKPSDEGSTFGLSIVENESGLDGAIGLASEYSQSIMVEKYIEGRELTVGILGDKVLPIVEIFPSHQIYDYDCKYSDGLSEYAVPADIPEHLERSLVMDAMKIYKAIGCRHYARVDFRLDENEKHYMLEVNALPGMTGSSLLPKAALSAGLSFNDLVGNIIDMALIK